VKEPSKEDILLLLEREIKKTKATIEDYKLSSGPIAPEDAIGRISRMDAINNRTIVQTAQRNAEEKLKKLERMREGIDSPDFGKCINCGNKIQTGRVILKPESPYCVKCAG